MSYTISYVILWISRWLYKYDTNHCWIDLVSWVDHWFMKVSNLQHPKEFNIQQCASEWWWIAKCVKMFTREEIVHHVQLFLVQNWTHTYTLLPFPIYRLCKLLMNLLPTRLAQNLHIIPNIVPNESTKCWAFHWEEVDCKAIHTLCSNYMLCPKWKPSN